MKLFNFILGIGYSLMALLGFYGFIILISESSLIYSILALIVTGILIFCSYITFKKSFLKETTISTYDIPAKDMLIQNKQISEDILIKELPKEETHYCPYCGHLVIVNWKYCYSCGKEIKTDKI